MCQTYEIDELFSLKEHYKQNPFICKIQITRKILYTEDYIPHSYNPRNTKKFNKRNSRYSNNSDPLGLGSFRSQSDSPQWPRLSTPKPLERSENAWKPVDKDNIKEEESIIRKVNGIMNKLSIDNFDTHISTLLQFKFTPNLIKKIVEIIFQKAIMETHFSELYAKLCVCFGNFNVHFKRQLVGQCMEEFQKNDIYADIDKEVEEIKQNTTTPPTTKKYKLEDLEYKRKTAKMQLIGNVCFIGQLFNLQMITETTLHTCIKKFINPTKNEDIECLCKFFEISGSKIKGNDINTYFEKMKQIADDKQKFDTRCRFMIKDIIDLRKNRWIPRRKVLKVQSTKEIREEMKSPHRKSKVKWADIRQKKERVIK